MLRKDENAEENKNMDVGKVTTIDHCAMHASLRIFHALSDLFKAITLKTKEQRQSEVRD